MPFLLGTNVGHDPIFRAIKLAKIGINTVRIVLQKHVDLGPYIRECHDRGIAVMGVVAKESLTGFESQTEAAHHYVLLYGGLLDYLQIGNESDHESPSSWTMTRPALNGLISAFATSFRTLSPETRLVGPGMVSGDPHYLDKVDLVKLDYIAVHPYAKWQRDDPATPEDEDVYSLIDSYAYHGKPILVTEFGWPHPNWQEQGEWFSAMLERMDDHPMVAGMLSYCADDLQNPNFGLLSWGVWKGAAYALRAYSERKGLLPSTMSKPEFVLGFKNGYDADPELVGDPKENERGGIPGFSQQLTTNGVLTWADLKKQQVMTFYHAASQRRFVFTGTHWKEV